MRQCSLSEESSREQSPHQGCSRSYASVGALRNHLRGAHAERRMLPRSPLSFKARRQIDERLASAAASDRLATPLTLSTAMAVLEEILPSPPPTPNAPQPTPRHHSAPSLLIDFAVHLRRTASAPPCAAQLVQPCSSTAHLARPPMAPRRIGTANYFSTTAVSPHHRQYRATPYTSVPCGDLRSPTQGYYSSHSAATTRSSALLRLEQYVPPPAPACTPPHYTGVVPWHRRVWTTDQHHDGRRLDKQHFQSSDIKYDHSGDIMTVMGRRRRTSQSPTSSTCCSFGDTVLQRSIATPYSTHHNSPDLHVHRKVNAAPDYTHTDGADFRLVQEICALIGIGNGSSALHQMNTTPLTATRMSSNHTLARTLSSTPAHAQMHHPTTTQLHTSTGCPGVSPAWIRMPFFAPSNTYSDSSVFAFNPHDESYSPRVTWSDTCSMSTSSLSAVDEILMGTAKPAEIDIGERQMHASSLAAQEQHLYTPLLDTARYMDEVVSRVSCA